MSWGLFLSLAMKAFFPAIGLAVMTYIAIQIKNLYQIKKQNSLESIKLEGEKIAINVQNTDLDTLISDANSDHGVRIGLGQSVPDITVKKK